MVVGFLSHIKNFAVMPSFPGAFPLDSKSVALRLENYNFLMAYSICIVCGLLYISVGLVYPLFTSQDVMKLN